MITEIFNLAWPAVLCQGSLVNKPLSLCFMIIQKYTLVRSIRCSSVFISSVVHQSVAKWTLAFLQIGTVELEVSKLYCPAPLQWQESASRISKLVDVRLSSSSTNLCKIQTTAAGLLQIYRFPTNLQCLPKPPLNQPCVTDTVTEMSSMCSVWSPGRSPVWCLPIYLHLLPPSLTTTWSAVWASRWRISSVSGFSSEDTRCGYLVRFPWLSRGSRMASLVEPST